MVKIFQTSWLQVYPWLKFENGKMFCTVCSENGGQNTLTTGTDNFRTSTLTRHVGQGGIKTEHQKIIDTLRLRDQMEVASKKALKKSEKGVVAGKLNLKQKNY